MATLPLPRTPGPLAPHGDELVVGIAGGILARYDRDQDADGMWLRAVRFLGRTALITNKKASGRSGSADVDLLTSDDPAVTR
jgi:hypothetical protein